MITVCIPTTGDALLRNGVSEVAAIDLTVFDQIDHTITIMVKNSRGRYTRGYIVVDLLDFLVAARLLEAQLPTDLYEKVNDAMINYWNQQQKGTGQP